MPLLNTVDWLYLSFCFRSLFKCQTLCIYRSRLRGHKWQKSSRTNESKLDMYSLWASVPFQTVGIDLSKRNTNKSVLPTTPNLLGSPIIESIQFVSLQWVQCSLCLWLYSSITSSLGKWGCVGIRQRTEFCQTSASNETCFSHYCQYFGYSPLKSFNNDPIEKALLI